MITSFIPSDFFLPSGQKFSFDQKIKTLLVNLFTCLLGRAKDNQGVVGSKNITASKTKQKANQINKQNPLLCIYRLRRQSFIIYGEVGAGGVRAS